MEKKYTDNSNSKGVLYDGLNEKADITQESPRKEVKGSEKPNPLKETVKTPRGSFKIC